LCVLRMGFIFVLRMGFIFIHSYSAFCFKRRRVNAGWLLRCVCVCANFFYRMWSIGTKRCVGHGKTSLLSMIRTIPLLITSGLSGFTAFSRMQDRVLFLLIFFACRYVNIDLLCCRSFRLTTTFNKLICPPPFSPFLVFCLLLRFAFQQV